MAAGDISLTTPRQVGTLKFSSLHFNADDNMLVVEYKDDTGRILSAVIKNGECIGFNFATGAPVRIRVSDALTRALSALFKVDARTALTSQIAADGIVIAPGVVG